MPCPRRMQGLSLLSALFSVCLLSLCGCGDGVQAASASQNASGSPPGSLSFASEATDPLASYDLTGDIQPVHDPSIIRQGSTYYLFTTDVYGMPPGNYLPIRCSQDKINWTACGSIFPSGIPEWVQSKVPGINGIWAPDVSYFNGLYHVYYAGSTLGSQRSVIGLVTTPTLDSADPAYHWTDRGEVLESEPGNDFNAIDPNIFLDSDGTVWLTYGSYWGGIKQRQIDLSTGMLLASNTTRYNLATRPGVPNNPIEGASLVTHKGYYYLFVSIDYCCNADVTTDDYKEAMGRSSSPHGPFVDENGTPMMNGGGTVLLKADATWNAPGGGTAYLDPSNGDSLIVFHALKMTENGALYLWLKNLTWSNDWPSIAP